MVREIEKAIAIQADAHSVWRVLVEPALIRQWLSDADLEVSVACEIGGEYASHGNWHGLAVTNKGRIVELEAGRILAYKHWSSLSQVPDREENYSLIRWELGVGEGEIALTLRQDNLLTFEIYSHWSFYWNLALPRIKRLAELGTL